MKQQPLNDSFYINSFDLGSDCQSNQLNLKEYQANSEEEEAEIYQTESESS
jgi:hypothetical protein